MTVDYRRLSRKDFRLEMLLGLGRSSQVYLAKAPDGARVALKVPRREVRENKHLADRFAQEVALSLTLSHPNLVKGLSGRPAGNGAFLALEYFPEGSLEDLIVQAPLPQANAIECLKQLASAVIFLHSQSIVHQDIKTSNVYLCSGTYKLGDLGVAKTRDNPRPLERAGSPFYMAPELFRGEAASPASDAYSLGVLAFELLTGKRPFRADTYEELSYAHLHNAPPATRLEKHLDEAVRGLMAKEPSSRWTVQQFLNALEGKPRVAKPSSSEEPKGKKLSLQRLFSRRIKG